MRSWPASVLSPAFCRTRTVLPSIVEFVFDGDDELAVDRPQGFRFFVEPGVVVFVESDLEDELLLPSLVTSRASGRRTLAQNTIDDETMRKSVASFGVSGSATTASVGAVSSSSTSSSSVRKSSTEPMRVSTSG